MSGRFVIDALPESVARYRDDHVIVAVDVFRATTTIVTAVAAGRRVYPADGEAEARRLAERFPDASLAGELAGIRPAGFELDNSPAAVALLTDSRPLILISSAGTRLLGCARGAPDIYIACFRNISASAASLAESRWPVALIGAGARGQSRPEDSMACARIGRALLQAGLTAEDGRSAEEVAQWADLDVQAVRRGPSSDFLRSTGQSADIDFVVEHIDDLDLVVTFDGLEARVHGPEVETR